MVSKRKIGKIRKTWWMKPSTSEQLATFAKSAGCFYGEGPGMGEFLDLVAKGSIGSVGDNWVITFPKE